ncbi:MAG: tyrosine-type recombinase/integrase [Syntrophorhabdaceae bacterium]
MLDARQKIKMESNRRGRSFRRYREKSGITKHFVLHTLRHTTATQLSDKGVPMNCIQHILGHSRLETMIKYCIGAAEKSRAKEIMKDGYYTFIPNEMLE